MKAFTKLLTSLERKHFDIKFTTCHTTSCTKKSKTN